MKRLLGVLVTVTAVLLTSCTTGADRLEILRSDPMADYDLPNALAVRVTESPGGTGPGVGAPATLRRTFTVPHGTVVAELAATAG